MGNIFVIIAFVAYALVILGIGIFSYKKSKSMNDYFIGGRQLGSWTTAISAQASDMSGWLLMGLPGAIFVSGLTESWIAIGLFIGTYLNWKILAARLRKMSYAAGDAITIPEYFQKRFFTQNPVIRFACAAIIFVFMPGEESSRSQIQGLLKNGMQVCPRRIRFITRDIKRKLKVFRKKQDWMKPSLPVRQKLTEIPQCLESVTAGL